MKTYYSNNSNGSIFSSLTVRLVSGNGTVTGHVKTWLVKTGQILSDSTGEVAVYHHLLDTYFWQYEQLDHEGETIKIYEFECLGINYN